MMNTCLHYVAYGDCRKEVLLEAIIYHSIGVNATNKNNVTALMIACWKSNKDAINALLNTGADPNIVNARGNTCLHFAARNDYCTEVLQAIIRHGVDVNTKNKDNVTALMIAYGKANIEAITVLLNAGADPSIPDADGYTPLRCLWQLRQGNAAYNN